MENDGQNESGSEPGGTQGEATQAAGGTPAAVAGEAGATMADNHGHQAATEASIAIVEPVAGAPIEAARAEGYASGQATADHEANQRQTEEAAYFAQHDDGRRAGFTFSFALAALKAGQRVAREGWNGKKMFLFLVNGSTFEVNREPLLSIFGRGRIINYQPHIDMFTANGTIVPWLASQSDLLADDWYILDELAAEEQNAAA